MKESEAIQSIFRRIQEAETRRGPWVSIWRDCGRYVDPIKTQIGTGFHGQKTPNRSRHDLFDATAQEALGIYASGCLEWLTPANRPWFAMEPPRHLADREPVKKWCAEVTEEMSAEFAASNYYGEIHTAWLDDGAYGMVALNCEEDGGLKFEEFEIGDYCVLNDHQGRVDTLYREVWLSPRQAAQQFGMSNLSEDVREIAENPNSKKLDEKIEFVHAIFPREDDSREPGRIDNVNMPVADLYIEKKTKNVARESGHMEMPVSVGRHLKWGRSPYGFAPSWNALVDARQVDNMQMNLDVLAEVAAFPRIKAHPDLEGEIDLRKGGVTYKENDQEVEEWATAGRYDIGKDRVIERQQAIHRAFHTPLFNMFSQFPPGHEMTALEVQARLEDKLTLFSPIFARKMDEVLDPTIMRAYGIMLRAGAFPAPPSELVSFVGGGSVELAMPKIRYQSRLALAIDRIHNNGLSSTLNTFAQLFEYRPELLDNFDLDTALREASINNGMPVDWQKDPQERDEMREQRQEQLLQQQAAEMAAGAA